MEKKGELPALEEFRQKVLDIDSEKGHIETTLNKSAGTSNAQVRQVVSQPVRTESVVENEISLGERLTVAGLQPITVRVATRRDQTGDCGRR